MGLITRTITYTKVDYLVIKKNENGVYEEKNENCIMEGEHNIESAFQQLLKNSANTGTYITEVKNCEVKTNKFKIDIIKFIESADISAE